MRVTLDQVGRIVIPKLLRTRLGIEPETELEISIDGLGLRLDPLRTRTRTVKMVEGFPVLRPPGSQTITDEDVRRLREDDQR
jgi:AbrB family looped-hinge helix DNA binding protein